MKFTGRNLVLLRDAVSWAISDVQSQIGQCPNVYEYEEDIEALEALKARLEKMLARIETGVANETNQSE